MLVFWCLLLGMARPYLRCRGRPAGQGPPIAQLLLGCGRKVAGAGKGDVIAADDPADDGLGNGVLSAQFADPIEKRGSHGAARRPGKAADDTDHKRAARLKGVPRDGTHEGQDDDGDEPVRAHFQLQVLHFGR